MMKSKRFESLDIVGIVLAVLLVAVMCVTMFMLVRDTKQVASADTIPVTDNLLRANALSNGAISYNQSVPAHSFAYTSFSYATGIDYPLFYLCMQNDRNSATTMYQNSNTIDISAWSTYPTQVTCYFGFATINTCSAGSYTFSFNETSNLKGYHFILGVYTLVDGALVSLSSTDVDFYATDATYRSFTFTASSDFDNVIFSFKVYSSSNSSNNSVRITNVYMCEGSVVLDGSELVGTNYSAGYNAGYQTAYYEYADTDNEGEPLEWVNDNLFEYHFDSAWNDTMTGRINNNDSYEGWQLKECPTYVDYQFINAESQSLFSWTPSVSSEVGGVVTYYSYSMALYYNFNDLDAGDYTFSILYDYTTSNFTGNKLLTITFTKPSVDPSAETYFAEAQGDDGVIIQAVYYSGNFFLRIAKTLDEDSALLIAFAKLEHGAAFTGFVPKSYSNYGYNQGYNDGYNAYDTARGFKYLGNLSFASVGASNYIDNELISTDFSYNGYTYRLSGMDYESETRPFDYINTTNETVTGTYLRPGFKISSPYLFGNIRMSIPYFYGSVNRYVFVFFNTRTGLSQTITFDDSVHVTVRNTFALSEVQSAEATLYAEYDTWYWLDIDYYSEDVVEIYCVPANLQLTNYSYPEYALRWGADEHAIIYASGNNDVYYSFDEGYQKGKADANEKARDLIANAEDAGYHRGKSEGIQEANNYTFIGLLSSVVDAPITALFGSTDDYGNRVGGLFNVNILGVDMTAFFTALLSLMLIIGVIRIALKVAT